jgi:hypothetical protein
MAIDNPFEITYGSRAVGGTSDVYQIHGPYVIDKTYESIRVVFDIVVTGDSYADLENNSNTLEDDFRARDLSFLIDLDNVDDPAGSSLRTYTFGSHATNDGILNSKATISKTGDSESDRGFSRAYTVVIEGDLPADNSSTNGLREVQWTVDYEAGRQRIVTMRGIYTAAAGSAASVHYAAASPQGAAGEANTFLTALSGSAAYELVDESYSPDRNDHLVTFERQYVELLANQSQASLDDTDIRDHSVRFVQLINQPGDAAPDLNRLRQVIGDYACAIDIDQTTDLQATYTNKVRPHVVALFESTFSPAVFCVEDSRVSYDETTKRMAVALQFLYQSSEGGDIVELQQTTGVREARTLDRTPVHTDDGLAAYVDPGWDIAERISARTITAIGLLVPISRLGDRPSRTGWNVVSNLSQVEPRWVGDPTTDEQIQLSVLTETVVESFNTRPGGGLGRSNYTPGSGRPAVFAGGPR